MATTKKPQTLKVTDKSAIGERSNDVFFKEATLYGADGQLTVYLSTSTQEKWTHSTDAAKCFLTLSRSALKPVDNKNLVGAFLNKPFISLDTTTPLCMVLSEMGNVQHSLAFIRLLDRFCQSKIGKSDMIFGDTVAGKMIKDAIVAWIKVRQTVLDHKFGALMDSVNKFELFPAVARPNTENYLCVAGLAFCTVNLRLEAHFKKISQVSPEELSKLQSERTQMESYLEDMKLISLGLLQGGHRFNTDGSEKFQINAISREIYDIVFAPKTSNNKYNYEKKIKVMSDFKQWVNRSFTAKETKKYNDKKEAEKKAEEAKDEEARKLFFEELTRFETLYPADASDVVLPGEADITGRQISGNDILNRRAAVVKVLDKLQGSLDLFNSMVKVASDMLTLNEIKDNQEDTTSHITISIKNFNEALKNSSNNAQLQFTMDGMSGLSDDSITVHVTKESSRVPRHRGAVQVQNVQLESGAGSSRQAWGDDKQNPNVQG